jgi:signal peptidase I
MVYDHVQNEERCKMKRIMGTTMGLFVIAFIIIGYMFTVITVDGESMNPTLENREKVFVNSRAFMFGEAKIGDIVVANYNGEIIVKRVVGVPGNTIVFTEDNVFKRDGVEDPKIVLPDVDDNPSGVYVETELKEGEYYLLGDNIEVSSDSRDMGAFDASQLLGKVIFK